jgi:hypothetical protein
MALFHKFQQCPTCFILFPEPEIMKYFRAEVTTACRGNNGNGELRRSLAGSCIFCLQVTWNTKQGDNFKLHMDEHISRSYFLNNRVSTSL